MEWHTLMKTFDPPAHVFTHRPGLGVTAREGAVRGGRSSSWVTCNNSLRSPSSPSSSSNSADSSDESVGAAMILPEAVPPWNTNFRSGRRRKAWVRLCGISRG